MATTRLKLLGTLLLLLVQSSTAQNSSTEAVSTDTSSSVSQCAPLKTLSFDCVSECGVARPCIRYASVTSCSQSLGGAGETPSLSACIATSTSNSSSNSTRSSCSVECFKMSEKDASATGNRSVSASAEPVTSFQFFIPFSLKSLGGRPIENATGGFPSKNEDALTDIAILNIPETVTDVIIAGGTNTTGVKGRVVQVALAGWLLSTKTNLRAVTLANMNVKALPNEMFPMALVNLTLTNLYLESLPGDLPSQTKLERLNLTQNTLTKFPTKFGMDSLKILDVSSNNLDKFDAVSPNLEYLDLSNNVLEALPTGLFQMAKLQFLNLSANAFTGVTLDSSQFSFLSTIPALVVDSFGPSSCSASSLQQLSNGVSVCVDANITTATSHPTSNSATLIGGVSAAVAVMLLIVGSVFWMRSRRRADDKTMTTNYSPSVGGTDSLQQGNSSYASSGNYTNLGTSSTRRSLWDDQELVSLQVRCEDIEDIKRIGTGAFGVVWLAKYRQTQLVASKRVKRDEVTWQRTQDFIAEIKLMSKLDHKCILPLIGVAWTIESDLQALFEYMEKGDLRSYLVRNAEDFAGVWTAEKLNIALNVADALVYLHSFSPPLVHRDLKSRNVLLGKDMEAKLSDFGVSRFQSEQATMTAGVGTGRWLAPEVISGSSDYNQSCDIFALGVVLSEMDTHELPYANLRGPMDNELNEVAVLQMVAAGTLTPKFSPDCPPKILELATKCLSFDALKRPTAFQVTYALRTILASDDY